jgi:hypothetical protein
MNVLKIHDVRTVHSPSVRRLAQNGRLEQTFQRANSTLAPRSAVIPNCEERLASFFARFQPFSRSRF